MVKIERKPSPKGRKGDWSKVNNLKFLVDFMDEMGLTTTSVAEKVGLSRQSIFYWLDKDEAKLSAIDNVFKAFGYKLSFDFEKIRPEGTASITMNVRKEEESDGRLLSFLDSALNRYHIDRASVSEALGIGKTTIYYWLTHDDIFVSYIFKIAEAADLKVKICINPIER